MANKWFVIPKKEKKIFEKEKIILGSNGIKKVLKGFSPEEAVAEYIWNRKVTELV